MKRMKLKLHLSKFLIFILSFIATSYICNSSHPDNIYWHHYFEDKHVTPEGQINCILYEDGNLFVSGLFGTRIMDSLDFNGLAYLENDTAWSPLGTGSSAGFNTKYGFAIDMLLLDTILYVGGGFDTVGNVAANSIARWNISSSTWTPIGDGIKGAVIALDYNDSTNILYAGGEFDSVGTSRVNNIAKWNGSTWSALGDGISGFVYDIISDDEDVYVVGKFDTAGTVAVNNIAKWDHSANSWNSVGGGTNGRILSIRKINSTFYIAGNFDTVFTGSGSFEAKSIASFSSSTWSALGEGIDGYVLDMDIDYNGNLYVAGDFLLANGDTVNNIAKYDGSNWSELGSGTNCPIYTLACIGDSVLIGGNFVIAGDTLSEYMSLWYKPPPGGKIGTQNIDKTKISPDCYIKVYPNPVIDGSLTIEYFTNTSGSVKIEIVDITGKIRNTFNYEDCNQGRNTINWESNDLEAGSYICRLLISGIKICHTKFIKVR